MPSFFRIVNLLCIQLCLASTAYASSGIQCHFTQGPVGVGYRAECDNIKSSWYPTFDQALVDLYAAERHGLVHFDWDQIQAQCREMHYRKDFCEKL